MTGGTPSDLGVGGEGRGHSSSSALSAAQGLHSSSSVALSGSEAMAGPGGVGNRRCGRSQLPLAAR
ncbi:MAG: hypothetical protein OXF99_05705 [bacterium]|nr:hypothetical protein [bacterium]